MACTKPSVVSLPGNAVTATVAQRIRKLHAASSRDLDRVAAEIITTVESFRAQGMLTTDQATQLIFDVRNERSRISR
jgi:hypothetical protein